MCNCVFEYEQQGNVKIGRRASELCQECLDIQAQELVKRQKEADQIRLLEIDRECGPRSVREALIALGHKGFNNKIETLENEAKTIRARK